MPTLTPIRIAMILKGEYNAETIYSPLDIITYNNNLYCCKTLTTAGENPETTTSKWVLLITGPTI